MLLFERMHSLCGMENVLAGLYADRDRMEDLADRIVDFDLAVIRNIGTRFPGRIHGFTFSDDWGSEEATLQAGLDCLNLQQPRALGVQEIGRRFAGRLCFESLCDIQTTLHRPHARGQAARPPSDPSRPSRPLRLEALRSPS